MNCPFCGEPLQPTHRSANEYWCENYDCPNASWMFGSQTLWKALIDTKKTLDICVIGLEKMTWGCDSSDAEHLLKEITATLENKKTSKVFYN